MDASVQEARKGHCHCALPVTSLRNSKAQPHAPRQPTVRRALPRSPPDHQGRPACTLVWLQSQAGGPLAFDPHPASQALLPSGATRPT